jgi:hypothetical protein
MKTLFVLFSEQRTGSNYLLAGLRQNNQIVSLNELLNLDKEAPIPATLSKERFAEMRKDDPVGLLRDHLLADEAWPAEVTTVGFKFQYHNVRATRGKAVIDHFMERPDQIRAIHLIRRNAFERFVSKLNAEKTEQYFAKNESALRRSPDPYRIEPAVAERGMRRYIRDIANVRKVVSKFPNRINVFYEDLVSNYASVMLGIQEFIGVDPVEVAPASAKQSIEPRFQIRNYNRLRALFSETDFKKYFDEGPGY